MVGYNDPDVPLTPTTTTVSVSPISTVADSTVEFSGTAVGHGGSGAPSGSITFTTGSDWLCTAPLVNGSGTCTDATAPPGSDSISAVYSGDESFATSAATTTLHVGSGIVCAEIRGIGFVHVEDHGLLFIFWFARNGLGARQPPDGWRDAHLEAWTADNCALADLDFTRSRGVLKWQYPA